MNKDDDKYEYIRKFSLTELDDKLNSDADGKFKKDLKKQLDDYASTIKSKLQSGDLSPQEFEAGERLHKAFGAALTILEKRK